MKGIGGYVLAVDKTFNVMQVGADRRVRQGMEGDFVGSWTIK